MYCDAIRIMRLYLYPLILTVGCTAQNYAGSNAGLKTLTFSTLNNVKNSILSSAYGAPQLSKFGIVTDNLDGDNILNNNYGRSTYNDLSGYSENRNIGYLLDRMYKFGNPFNDNNKQGRVDGKNLTFAVDAGNPDINAKIQRPCEVYDTYCIRRFFASHSRCRISEGPVPDPLYRAQLTANYPRVNISAMQTNIEYRGLNNARVEEFYINTATDNLVIALEFDAVSLFSNSSYLKFYLRGREPIVTTDFGGLTYEKVSVTAVIPEINDLRLDKAEMFSFANTPVYLFIVGPGLLASPDPAVLIMVAAFQSNLRVNQQEALLTEGNFYAATYIQKNICDFGLKVL